MTTKLLEVTPEEYKYLLSTFEAQGAPIVTRPGGTSGVELPGGTVLEFTVSAPTVEMAVVVEKEGGRTRAASVQLPSGRIVRVYDTGTVEVPDHHHIEYKTPGAVIRENL